MAHKLKRIVNIFEAMRFTQALTSAEINPLFHLEADRKSSAKSRRHLKTIASIPLLTATFVRLVNPVAVASSVGV
jgi:hypothetical protein